ncbi:MAG: helix-turn-helix domain-containing protein [Gammaproteobacteria bacterium]|jgi:transcriptional regulator GlxA family with amidase domain|nr:AraC family transcriptional regulator [Gammaproteobacteria bacterium]MDP6094588.1 helix-turn-helix domain-containing protein [Gammaproteobacteria bacterium]MDP7455192.1 helix-turn-helix domain-containing protein [Gammaproteobacteria bacterium]|tara:strand:+ start:195 stop:1217 length:1023 start_codon:yes stop_codon:yes gene_type:complete
MVHTTILAVEKALGTSITIPLEMLSAANDIARARKQRNKIIAIDITGPESGSIKLSGDLLIQCNKRLNEITRTDLIFVPGIWGNPKAAVKRHPDLVTWLQDQYCNGATICSIVTGSYFLAEAGLLDEKAATTHWRFFDQFENLFPSVKLQRKRFITCADRLYCTGSVNAARDIMSHFVEQYYGAEIASEVSRHFTHELKRSYESLLLNKDQHSTHHDEEIIKIQEWLQDHYSNSIQMAEVARQFKLGVRSLNRRFKAATNKTPLEYLQELRVNNAKALLKQSNLIVSEISYKVGYQDASYFTGLFKKLNSVTPNEYRSLVRNKLFAAETEPEDVLDHPGP